MLTGSLALSSLLTLYVNIKGEGESRIGEGKRMMYSGQKKAEKKNERESEQEEGGGGGGGGV